MTFRDIEILVAITKYGSMSKTASELFISPSSVSQVVSRIEKEYGLILFERLGHTLYLTEQGKAMLEYGKRILGDRNMMESCMKDVSREKPILRVGATITVGADVIGSLLNDISAKGIPFDASVEVENIYLIESGLLESKLDVALVEGPIRNPYLISRPVIGDELVVLCGQSHPFYGRKVVQLEEVAEYPLIMWDKGSRTRAQFVKTLEERELPYRVSWQCCGAAAIKSGVIAGYGITVMSYRLAKEELTSGALSSARIEGLDMRRDFSLVYHKNKYITEIIRAFIEACETWEQVHEDG